MDYKDRVIDSVFIQEYTGQWTGFYIIATLG